MTRRLLFGTTLMYFDELDVALLKLSLIAFTLFLVTIWPAFDKWVMSVNWIWFFVAFVIFAIRPLIKAFKK